MKECMLIPVREVSLQALLLVGIIAEGNTVADLSQEELLSGIQGLAKKTVRSLNALAADAQ